MTNLKHGIKIRLLCDRQFDLAELLAPIGVELLRTLSWKVQIDFFVVQYENEFAKGAEFVAPIGNGYIQCRIDRRQWSYEQLERFSREIPQVVDGEFTGYKTTPKGKKKWLVLTAFDSALWEVWSEDLRVIEWIKEAFAWAEDLSPTFR